MSQKIEGTPPTGPLRATPIASHVSRSGDVRDRPVEAAAGGDSLRLTGEAASLQAMRQELSARPAVDDARVQAVREAIASGTYRIDPEAIATAMLELDGQLRG